MKHILLLRVNPELDVDFLNETDIEFSFKNKSNPYDSGWCDFETGSRILTSHDSIIFVAKTTEDELALRIRFGDRIT